MKRTIAFSLARLDKFKQQLNDTLIIKKASSIGNRKVHFEKSNFLNWIIQNWTLKEGTIGLILRARNDV